MNLRQVATRASTEEKRLALAHLRLSGQLEGLSSRHAEAAFLWRHLGGSPPEPLPPGERKATAFILSRTASALADHYQGLAASLCLELSSEVNPDHDTTMRLLRLLEQSALYEDAVSVARSALAAEKDADHRLSIYQSLTHLLENRLYLHGEAADAFGAMLREFPATKEILSGRARCLEAARRFDELIAVIEIQLTLEQDSGDLTLLHTRLANLLDTVAKDPSRAIGHYRTAIALSPMFEPPIHGLLSLAEKSQNWPMVLEALGYRLRTEQRPKERSVILTRIGEIATLKLEQFEDGIRYLERALREYPRGLPARLLVLEILCARGDFQQAEKFATPPESAEAQGLGPDQVAHFCQIRAQVARHSKRAIEALNCLCLGLDVSPDPKPLVEDLIDLLEHETPDTSVPEVLPRLTALWERDGRTELASLGHICIGKLLEYGGRIEEAAAALQSARALRPDDLEPIQALVDLHIACRRFEAAVEVLTTAAPQSPTLTTRLTLWAARLLADHLGDAARAAELLEALHQSGGGTPQTALFAAALWVARRNAANARGALQLAERLGSPVPADLSAAVLELEAAPSEELEGTLSRGAASGELGSLRALTRRLLARGDEARPIELAAALGHEGRRVVADELARSGRKPLAITQYRAALEASNNGNVEAILGLAALDPLAARLAAYRVLARDAFELRLLMLLASLPPVDGKRVPPLNLQPLAVALRDGVPPPSEPFSVKGWHRSIATHPLVEFVAHLRQVIPQAFDAHEESIWDECAAVDLPPDIVTLVTDACIEAGLSVPHVVIHESVGSEPVALSSPPTLAVSPRLLAADMPVGALHFTVLKGLAMFRLGAAPITYLAQYQMDLITEALRGKVAPENLSGSTTPQAILSAALDVTPQEAEVALSWANSRPRKALEDPLRTWPTFDSALQSSVLSVTRDLVGALSGLVHIPPPTAPLQAARFRWMNEVSRIPRARGLVGYTANSCLPSLST